MDSVSNVKGKDKLGTWLHYVKLFSLIDSGKSLSEIAELTGLNRTTVSKIRSGNRSQDARLVYDKYKLSGLSTYK